MSFSTQMRTDGGGYQYQRPRSIFPRFGDRRRIRVGLLGGSFNPAHDGHRLVAKMALRRLRLDQVWLLVSPGNPLKSSDGMAPLAERLSDSDPVVRLAAHEELRKRTGQDFGYVPWASPEERAGATERWRAFVGVSKKNPNLPPLPVVPAAPEQRLVRRLAVLAEYRHGVEPVEELIRPYLTEIDLKSVLPRIVFSLRCDDLFFELAGHRLPLSLNIFLLLFECFPRSP